MSKTLKANQTLIELRSLKEVTYVLHVERDLIQVRMELIDAKLTEVSMCHAVQESQLSEAARARSRAGEAEPHMSCDLTKLLATKIEMQRLQDEHSRIRQGNSELEKHLKKLESDIRFFEGMREAEEREEARMKLASKLRSEAGMTGGETRHALSRELKAWALIEAEAKKLKGLPADKARELMKMLPDDLSNKLKQAGDKLKDPERVIRDALAVQRNKPITASQPNVTAS